MKTVLYVLAETIRCLAITIQPVTPDSANKILDQLSIPKTERSFINLRPAYTLEPNITINKPEGVFARIHIEEEQDKKEATA
jgi:methionyl-tRNA synthetase